LLSRIQRSNAASLQRLPSRKSTQTVVRAGQTGRPFPCVPPLVQFGYLRYAKGRWLAGKGCGDEEAVAADRHGHAWLGERDSYQLRTVIDDPVLADDDFTVSFTVVAC
jgi:hypothetical protein